MDAPNLEHTTICGVNNMQARKIYSSEIERRLDQITRNQSRLETWKERKARHDVKTMLNNLRHRHWWTRLQAD